MTKQLINVPTRDRNDFFTNTTVHEQDSDTGFYDKSALDRTYEIEYPLINGIKYYDKSHQLVLSRTRVQSGSETISSRDEDNAWLAFLAKHPEYSRK